MQRPASIFAAKAPSPEMFSTVRISVEDGAVLKGGIEVRSSENKQQKQPQAKAAETQKNRASQGPPRPTLKDRSQTLRYE